MVGGFLFTGLAMKLESKPFQELPDLDFICDEIGELSLPEGWKTTRTRFGGPKFTTPKFIIDLWCLRDHKNISRKELPPTIENYLATVPLTSQAIAYDLNRNCLLGEIWKESLISRTIRVHDSESFEVDRSVQVIKGYRKAVSLGYNFLG